MPKSVDFDTSVEYETYEDEDQSYHGIDRVEAICSLKEGIHRVGRPSYIPNSKHYDLVRALCLYGAPQKWISQYIGISEKTLRKYYPELLDNCKEDKIGAVETSLFINAVVKGNFQAQQYFLETQAKDRYNKNPIDSMPSDDDDDDILSIIADHVPD